MTIPYCLIITPTTPPSAPKIMQTNTDNWNITYPAKTISANSPSPVDSRAMTLLIAPSPKDKQ